jgi:hypothetical protein
LEFSGLIRFSDFSETLSGLCSCGAFPSRYSLGSRGQSCRFRIDAMERHIDERFGAMDKRIDGVEKRIDTLDSKIDNTTRWMVGLMLGSWITLMAAIFLHH